VQVLALRLSAHVSLTLVQTPSGWSFRNWTRSDGGRPLPEPPPAARGQSFPTPETAIAFFRAFYPAPQ
jgi:hypothetical protein